MRVNGVDMDVIYKTIEPGEDGDVYAYVRGWTKYFSYLSGMHWPSSFACFSPPVHPVNDIKPQRNEQMYTTFFIL